VPEILPWGVLLGEVGMLSLQGLTLCFLLGLSLGAGLEYHDPSQSRREVFHWLALAWAIVLLAAYTVTRV